MPYHFPCTIFQSFILVDFHSEYIFSFLSVVYFILIYCFVIFNRLQTVMDQCWKIEYFSTISVLFYFKNTTVPSLLYPHIFIITYLPTFRIIRLFANTSKAK